jgi:hypothetical protein
LSDGTAGNSFFSEAFSPVFVAFSLAALGAADNRRGRSLIRGLHRSKRIGLSRAEQTITTW